MPGHLTSATPDQVMHRAPVSRRPTESVRTANPRPGLPRFLQRAADGNADVDPSPSAEREAQSISATVAAKLDAPDDAATNASASAPASGSNFPLPAGLRAPMESAFGADFGDVRLHADSAADRLNRSLHARAFTTGNDIYLRPAEYRPQENGGRQLLAHELTHVVQQRAAPATTPGVQCQRMDGGVVEAEPRDAGETDRSGVPLPVPAPTPVTCDGPLGEFPANTRYIFGGNRFQGEYHPTAPEPTVDEYKIIHRIHVAFLPFSTRLIREQPQLFGRYRGVRFTAAQRAEFAWDETEQETFRNDFRTNVHDAWSDRHALVTNEPCFARYRASVTVNIEIVDDPATAHSTITAYKMPPDSARLRSEVRGGSSATLESRDPSAPTSNSVTPADVVRQVGPFDFDSAATNPEVDSDIDEAARAMRPFLNPADPAAGFPASTGLSFVGRASSEGGRAYNSDLGLRRAETVQRELNGELRIDDLRTENIVITTFPGERHATTDPQFRRVDIRLRATLSGPSTVSQNVAAHEFGHLIGFGDEYVDEVPPEGVVPKFEADRPTHFGDVESALGTDAANELLVQNSGSIMASGSEVRRGHYVYFLNALASVTGKSWTVE